MPNARLALSMSLVCGLALLTVVPLRAAGDAVDCEAYAELNLDAAAQRDLTELIDCHKSMSHTLDCHKGLRTKEPCPDQSTLDRKELRRLNVALANDERALRRQANELTTANETRKKLIDNLSTDTRSEDSSDNGKTDREKQKDDTSDQMASANADLKKIEAIVAYSEKKLFVNSEDYEDYFFRLNTGYEFVSIDKLFSSGSPRISLLVNSRTFGEDVNDRTDGFHFYGIRLNFAATLNSSAEVTPKLPGDDKAAPAKADDPPADPTDTTTDVKNTLGVEFQAVMPLIRTRLFSPNNLRSYVSLIGTVAGLKTDAQSRTIMRSYAGLRISINPELYSDFLIGHTEKLKSLRFEFRGQLPVYTLDSGDRIFLGGIINVGLNHKEESEGDTFRIYVSWNTDLKKLFSTNEGS